MNDDRLRAIEELVAHQARVIDEMSGEMALQGEQIRRMQARVDQLVTRLLEMEESVSGPAEARKPPHW